MDHSVIGKAVETIIEMMAKHLGRAVREALAGASAQRGRWFDVQPTKTVAKKPTKTATKKPTKTATKTVAKTATKKPTKTATKTVAKTATKKPATKAVVKPATKTVVKTPTKKPNGANGSAEVVRGVLPPPPPPVHLSPHQAKMVAVLQDCRGSFVSGDELASRAGVSTSSIGGIIKRLRQVGFRVEGRRGGSQPGYSLIENA